MTLTAHSSNKGVQDEEVKSYPAITSPDPHVNSGNDQFNFTFFKEKEVLATKETPRVEDETTIELR